MKSQEIPTKETPSPGLSPGDLPVTKHHDKYTGSLQQTLGFKDPE